MMISSCAPDWAHLDYYYHCQEYVTPSPREGRAGRGARFYGFDVVWRPLSLTLSPLIRRGERESFVCDGGGIEMRLLHINPTFSA